MPLKKIAKLLFNRIFYVALALLNSEIARFYSCMAAGGIFQIYFLRYHGSQYPVCFMDRQ